MQDLNITSTIINLAKVNSIYITVTFMRVSAHISAFALTETLSEMKSLWIQEKTSDILIC